MVLSVFASLCKDQTNRFPRLIGRTVPRKSGTVHLLSDCFQGNLAVFKCIRSTRFFSALLPDAVSAANAENANGC